ncbi:MAG: hypothetical protein ACREPB_03050 [Arenimonas sp.]
MSVLNKFLIAASLALALSACKKEEPVEVAPAPVVVEPAVAPAVAPPPAPAAVTVTAVNLGTSVGADQKVTAATTTFGTKDVIYAAIDTQNAAKDVALAAKWTFQDGQTVHEESTMISPEGNATTNFKLANDKGWPVGKYKVEISLNGTPAQSVDFEVK